MPMYSRFLHCMGIYIILEVLGAVFGDRREL